MRIFNFQLLVGLVIAIRQVPFHQFGNQVPTQVHYNGTVFQTSLAEAQKLKTQLELLLFQGKQSVEKQVVEGKSLLDNFSKYWNHKVVTVQVNSELELQELERYVERHLVDVWTPVRLGKVDINLPQTQLQHLKLNFTTKIHNLAQAIQSHTQTNLEAIQEVFDFSKKKKYRFEPRDSFYRKYNTLETINSRLDTFIQKYPQVATKVTLGKSYEGRDIQGIRIENKSNKNSTKLVVFHGGHHSREWISVATTTYMLESILKGYNQPLSGLYKVLDKYSFVIIPVLNVDGYHYTFTEDRMWRKNRQPTSLPWCPGVDMNRNWDAHWGNKGASSSPCSEAYHGPSPFSAVELQVWTRFLKQQDNLIAYLDFHAYSQLFMFPYGYDCTKQPKGYADLSQVAQQVVQAIQQPFGTKFVPGGICTTIYQASGSSVDWTFDTLKVKYSFAVELRDTGNHGFLLPPNQIIPSGHETLQGLTTMLNQIALIEKL